MALLWERRLGPISKSSMGAAVTVVLGMRLYQGRVEGLPSGPLTFSGDADIPIQADKPQSPQLFRTAQRGPGRCSCGAGRTH